MDPIEFILVAVFLVSSGIIRIGRILIGRRSPFLSFIDSCNPSDVITQKVFNLFMRESFALHLHCIHTAFDWMFLRIVLKCWKFIGRISVQPLAIIVILFCGLLALIKRIDHHNCEKMVEGEAEGMAAHKLIFVSIIHQRLVECSSTTSAATLTSCCKWERGGILFLPFPFSLSPSHSPLSPSPSLIAGT